MIRLAGNRWCRLAGTATKWRSDSDVIEQGVVTGRLACATVSG
jgi:hypothetical protein